MYSFQHTAILFGIVVTLCVVSAQFNERLPMKERKPFPETPPVIRERLKTVELPPKKVDFFTQQGKLPDKFIDEANKKPGKRPDKLAEAPVTPDGEPIVPPPQGGSENAVISSIIIVPDLECGEGFAYDDKGVCREVW